MFHKVDHLFLLITLFDCLLVVVHSSNECGTCIENIQLQDLIENFDIFQAEIKYQKTESNQLKSENEEFKAQLLQQGEKILLLERQILKLKSFGPPIKPADSCSKKSKSPTSKKNEKSSSRALDLLPTSCERLRKEGHFANGVYLVLNEETNKINAVFCRFLLGAKQVSQDLIGQVDVKASIVHFYVQRESSFGPGGGVIPFDKAPVNEGNAFDLASGIFTIPVPGIYHFDFSAIKPSSSTLLSVFLQVNGANVGNAYTNDQGAPGSQLSVSLSASLRLAAGDTVNLFNFDGVLADDGNHWTHFSGWLAEEELM